jgi:hypothetical protein
MSIKRQIALLKAARVRIENGQNWHVCAALTDAYYEKHQIMARSAVNTDKVLNGGRVVGEVK